MNHLRLLACPLRILAAAVCIVVTSQAIADEPPNAKPGTIPDVEIEATLSTDGSYGELWSLHVTRGGRGYFRYLTSRRPPGELSGEFLFDLDAISKLATLSDVKSFDKLPKTIQPALLTPHAPRYTLSIQAGAARHAVELLQPDQVGQTAELARFTEVWNAIWLQLPFRPPSLPGVDKP